MKHKNMSKDLPKGVDLLRDPLLNRGTAFTQEERESLGLLGLLPFRVNSIESQVTRAIESIRKKCTDLEKYVYLTSLQERNKTLFYRLLLEHLRELMPIVYTPTVGQACLEYGHIFRSSLQGLFIASEYRGQIRKILQSWPYKDVRVIVVTDGERILGLGDLGVDGMGIPVGKLMLYTACAGIHPQYCLPVTLDVGTNNEARLKDPLYIGAPHQRLRGEAYDAFIEEFVSAAVEVFPHVLVQFEDFANANAFRLLKKYRDRACVFNDDIQGTASVALAGLYAATRILGGGLKDQRILFVGAGEAGLGTGHLVVAAMMQEGLSEAEARSRCAFMDSKGLVVSTRTDLDEKKRYFAVEGPQVKDCLEAVRTLRPTTLIGAAGRHGVFTQEVLETMAQINDRPVIFAMSNPTSLSECTAEEAYRYTQGRALFASGSPFPSVNYEGRQLTPGQSNNAYIFPGMGLGITASRSARVPDEMFLAAAKALASCVEERDLASGSLYPPLKEIRKVSLTIAEAVAEVAYREGLAEGPKPKDLRAYLQDQMYQPAYESYPRGN